MYNWRVKAMMNALEKAGKATGPLQLADLTALGHLDQYHYLGTQACDHVIELLGIQADASVLDIGSGIGGPARYLSANTGCKVVGVVVRLLGWSESGPCQWFFKVQVWSVPVVLPGSCLR